MQSTCFTCGAPLRIVIKGETFDVTDVTNKLGEVVGTAFEKRKDRPLVVGAELGPPEEDTQEMVEVMCGADPEHAQFIVAVSQVKYLAYQMIRNHANTMMKNYEVIG